METGMGRFLLLVFILLFVTGIGSCGVIVSENGTSIREVYGPAQTIEGVLNISLSNIPTNELLSDGFGHAIEIKKLLDLSEAEYECSTQGCLPDYIPSNPQNSKTFLVEKEEGERILEVLEGAELTGNITGISSFSFRISGSLSPSCSSQIKVDLFADGSIDFINPEGTSDLPCQDKRRWGCFPTGLASYEEYVLGPTSYCQKVELMPSPAFEIGAWIKKEDGASGDVIAELYDSSGNFVESCSLPDTTVQGETVSCRVNYQVKEPTDGYVCVYLLGSSGSENYKIRGTTQEKCGSWGGLPIQNPPTAAYSIFAQGVAFDLFKNLLVQNNYNGEKSLAEQVKDYLISKYGGLDCASGCIVPIRIIAEDPLKSRFSFSLDDLSVKYTKAEGISESTAFYDLEKSAAKVGSDFVQLDLSKAGFVAPTEIGNTTLELKLGEAVILTVPIRVVDVPVPKSLTPLATASHYPTNFTVELTKYENITKYRWEFGDNTSAVETTSSSIVHTYEKTGKYNLTVSAYNDYGFEVSKTFVINVGLPQREIDNLLESLNKSLYKIKSRLDSYDLFFQRMLKETLNLSSLETELEQAQIGNLKENKTEEEMNSLLDRLLSLRVPLSVAKTKMAPLEEYYPSLYDINLEILKGIGGGANSSIGNGSISEEDVREWMDENVELKINFVEFSAYFEDEGEVPLFRKYNLKLFEKKDIPYDYYLVIKDVGGLKFEKNYKQEKKGEYFYIPSSELDRVLGFSIPGSMEIEELSIFVSPSVEVLQSRISEGSDLGRDEENSSMDYRYVVIVALLILIGVAIYLIWAHIKKRLEERNLFKNRNNLYNLVHYIYQSKKKGYNDSTIRRNLRRSGWTKAQIDYVMREYSGKKGSGGILSKLLQGKQRRK